MAGLVNAAFVVGGSLWRRWSAERSGSEDAGTLAARLALVSREEASGVAVRRLAVRRCSFIMGSRLVDHAIVRGIGLSQRSASCVGITRNMELRISWPCVQRRGIRTVRVDTRVCVLRLCLCPPTSSAEAGGFVFLCNFQGRCFAFIDACAWCTGRAPRGAKTCDIWRAAQLAGRILHVLRHARRAI